MRNSVLDQSKLTLDQAKHLNKININSKGRLENLLKEIFKKTDNGSKWILSPLFSRDQTQCRFFSDLNFLQLIDHFVIKKKINKVIVSNIFLKNIIKKKYSRLNVEVSGGIKHLALDLINVLNSFIKLTFYSFLMFGGKDDNRRRKFKNKKITMIETFFSKNLFSNNSFNERYHKEVYNNLPAKIKKNCFFFPINLSIFFIKKFLKIVKKDKMKFIHPLDFFEFKDYYDSIFLIPNLGKINSQLIKYQSYNIHKLIVYYKFTSYFNFSTFLANLNYNFLKRLKKNDTKIQLIIDWYENQIIDKGLCLGKNTFFPKSKIKGHMGFLNDFYNIHYYTPTRLEKKLNSLPDEILLISKTINNIFFKKIKFVNSKIVPAVRNKRIFNITLSSKRKKFKKNNILIILSSNLNETEFIFKLLKNVSDRFDLKKFNFIIKPHVNTDLKSFLKDNNRYKIAKDTFYNLLLDADIIVSGGTTATIEADILNKKIILIGNNDGVTLNPLLKRSVKKIEICYSSKQFVESLKKLSKKKSKEMINQKLLHSYFVKYNKKYFKNFYKQTA